MLKAKDFLEMILFTCKTSEGYIFKVLTELLQNNIKVASFVIDKSGITLRMMDPNKAILIDLDMKDDNFSVYKFKHNTRLYIGVNLSHLYKMLKPIKKNDCLQFCIDDSSINDLIISITPKESSRHTSSFIKIQSVQNINIDLPEGYEKSSIIKSSEFQKMCKGFIQISQITKIQTRKNMIRFSNDADGLMKRYTEFGEIDNFESSNEDEDDDYAEDYDTEQLTKVAKISGLSSVMHVYAKENLPLMMKSNVGNLGAISIYIKSKKMIENEKKQR